jgi:hypothetical protein
MPSPPMETSYTGSGAVEATWQAGGVAEAAWQFTDEPAASYQDLAGLLPQFQTVDVAPPGHAIDVAWDEVSGATGIEVDAASAYVAPVTVEESLGELPVTPDDAHRIVAVPGGKRIVRLNLNGLKKRRNADEDWASLSSSGDLAEAGPRLVVSIQDPTAGWIPLYTVPPVPPRGVLPRMFGGASFDSGVLTLPGEFPASSLRLSVVENHYPEDFNVLEMEVDHVYGWATLPPKDLELVGPDGGQVWAFPGELPANTPPIAVDLRFACESALNAALAAGEPLDTPFHLRGAAPGNVDFMFLGATGALVRTFPGVLRTGLAGEPELLALTERLEGVPLADEQPSSATADLTVRYDGLRLLAAVADQVPSTDVAIGGVVVAGEPVVRVLPEDVLGGLPAARAGLIGRAPEPCELSVQLVDISAGTPGQPLGPPGVIELEAAAAIRTNWIDLPEAKVSTGAVGLSAHANRGRFFWVCDPEPLLRLAVRDPDPGGRPLRLAGHQILAVAEQETHLPATTLPAVAFKSHVPIIESDLFLTVDLSDLILRYRR